MDSINQNRPQPELSIIIISFNTRQVTLNCLNSIYNSLLNSELIFEVIVIDNASQDGSVQAVEDLQKRYSNLVLVENKENIGFGRANNQAAHLANGKYLFFLNSDTLVLDNAVEMLLHFYKQNESHIHFLGGKLLNKDHTPQPSTGPFYNPFVVFGALFLKGDYWGLTRYSPDQPKKVDWVSGACILTTKELFSKLKGFDEDIFMYMEEIDLLYRAQKIGLTTYFYPEARFIHFGSVSSGGRSYPIIQVYKGFFYFYKKHYTGFYILLLRIMLQLKALVSILIGKMTGNKYLLETYEKAYHIASVA